MENDSLLSDYLPLSCEAPNMAVKMQDDVNIGAIGQRDYAEVCALIGHVDYQELLAI